MAQHTCDHPKCYCDSFCPPLICGHRLCGNCILTECILTHPTLSMMMCICPLCSKWSRIEEDAFESLMKIHRKQLLIPCMTDSGFCLATHCEDSILLQHLYGYWTPTNNFFAYMSPLVKRCPEMVNKFVTFSVPVRLLNTRTCHQLAEALERRRVQSM